MVINKVRIIGVGGIGSWLAGILTRKYEISIYDTDTIEESNLKRSLLPNLIGFKKADALVVLLKNMYSNYIGVNRVRVKPNDFDYDEGEIIVDATDSDDFWGVDNVRLIKVKAINGSEFLITNMKIEKSWELADENILQSNNNTYKVSCYLPILGVITLRILEEFEEQGAFYFRVYINMRSLTITYEKLADVKEEHLTKSEEAQHDMEE